MTNFDDLLNAWKAQDEKINDMTVTLNAIRRSEGARRIETPLRRLVTELGIEIGFIVIEMLILGSYLANQWRAPRFVWPALSLDIWLLALLIATIHQVVQARAIHYDGSVLQVQQQLAQLRTLRLTTLRWALLTGQIVWWIPFAITVFKLMFDIDLYRVFPLAFIVANLLFGVAMMPIAVIIATKMKRRDSGSLWERVGDAVAGRSLAEARQQAAALEEFS